MLISLAGTFIEDKGLRLKIPLEKCQGGTEDTSWRKYLIEDTLLFLQERTNRNEDYLILCQKCGFGGGFIFAYKNIFGRFLQIEPVDVCLKKNALGSSRLEKTFSTSGITFLSVRRLVKDTDQSRGVSISKKFVSASEEFLILQTPS